jgi:hypothetical protein
MPRTAWSNRIQKLQDEVGGWSNHYRRVARDSDSQVLSAKAQERAWDLEHLWHELDKVADYLERPWR